MSALDVIADYAEQVAAAERQAEQRSMEAARAMDALYESGEWVAEWLEQKPAPKRPTNRWNPADRNRFIAWQAWKLEQLGRKPIGRVPAWRLLEAAKVCKICTTGTDLAPEAESVYRPLFWLRKNRFEERLPDVWAIAVDLAGGDPRQVTSRHTREALAQWKKEAFGKRRDGTPRKTMGAITQAATAAGKANRLRRNVLDEVAEMYRLAGFNPEALAEFNGMLHDLEVFLNEKRAEVA